MADNTVPAVDWAALAGTTAEEHPLYPLFYPRSVAVVGASPKGGYGMGVITALRDIGFEGDIYPVNPNHPVIADLPAYPDLGSIPTPPDAVAIAVPSAIVPGVVEQAIAAGVRGGVAFGSGFAEAGDAGQTLQADLRRLCGTQFPLIGPNCLGVMNYGAPSALWSITIGRRRKVGSVALVAQSGNIALTLMASSRGLHLSHAVSAGNQAVVDVVDVMSFFLTEPHVRVIAAVIEGLNDVDKFRRVAAQAAERDIPIVALKLGRSERAQRAAVAHTGSLTGSDQLYDALFAQYGVIRVDDSEELMETCKLLSADRRPAGPGLAVFASSGGECGMISDLAQLSGVALPDLLPETRERLIEILPPFANPYNPLDATAFGWGNREMFSEIIATLAPTPGVDIIAFMGDTTRNSGPLSATGWEKMVAGLADGLARTDKPVAVINAITDVAYELTDELDGSGVIHLSGARTAARAIGHAGRYGRWQQQRRPLRHAAAIDESRRQQALTLLPAAGSGGVSETASKQLLALYGIPVPAGGLAADVEQAVDIASEVGYPLVLKIEADDIYHKTEVGGVALGIESEAQLRAEFLALLRRVTQHAPEANIRGVRVEHMATGELELIIGGRNDATFGPIVVVGMGGVLTEALQDVSQRLAPVDTEAAAAMLSELRGARLFAEFRGRPALNVAAVAEIVAAVSQLLSELPEVIELDINPILVGVDDCIAVDGLVVV